MAQEPEAQTGKDGTVESLSQTEKPSELTSREPSVVAPETGKEAPKSGTDPESAVDQTGESEYPKGLKLILIITSLCLSIFLVALDQTIIAPALGAITAEYSSVKDIVSNPPLSPHLGLYNECPAR
jgi:hypothetical protein